MHAPSSRLDIPRPRPAGQARLQYDPRNPCAEPDGQTQDYRHRALSRLDSGETTRARRPNSGWSPLVPADQRSAVSSRPQIAPLLLGGRSGSAVAAGPRPLSQRTEAVAQTPSESLTTQRWDKVPAVLVRGLAVPK